jgi:uncharacterized protein with PQ loop repeat
MELNLPVIAGTISTIIFALSTLPMLVKAYQTKDLRSYSLGNILLANVGNIIHSIYVFHLPPGPIWLLHAFYLVTTGLMLVWYLRYAWQRAFLSSLRLRPRMTLDHSCESPARPRASNHEQYPFGIPRLRHEPDSAHPYAHMQKMEV